MHRLTGVLADTVDAGDAAVQVNENFVLHLGTLHLCDNGDLDVDVLHVKLIHRGGGDEREKNGVDGGGQAERDGADEIEHQIPEEVHVADAGVRAAFNEHHAKKIHAAGGTAHPQKKADAAAAEHAANEAARELVAGENVCAWDEGEENGCAGDGKKRL